MRHPLFAAAIGAALVIATPAAAEVVHSDSGGFASVHSAVVAADQASVWRELVHPENWWSHSWSNNSANLSLHAQAGGCFCETIPASAEAPAGSVEHARVLAVMPHRTLRMSGALGPLQSEGLAGTLTVELASVEGGTRIVWSYVIGGHSRIDLGALASVVDSVQGEFLGGLTGQLGGDISSD